MSAKQLPITPETKIGELLECYPELEPVLIEIAPAFEKLRNPVLKRTLGKVTSLAQAARVGGVPVPAIVSRLREAIGLNEMEDLVDDRTGSNREKEPPDWFDQRKIVNELDARAMINNGQEPLGKVLSDLAMLTTGEIYQLTTPFEPAPLIDLAKDKGFAVWVSETTPGECLTYFTPQ